MPKSENTKASEVGDEKLYQDLCNRFELHIERFEQHEMDEVKHFSKLVKAQQKNTEAISTLTESVSVLVKDTSSIIRLHKDFQSAGRLGKSAHTLASWAFKLSMMAGIVAVGINWMIEHSH